MWCIYDIWVHIYYSQHCKKDKTILKNGQEIVARIAAAIGNVRNTTNIFKNFYSIMSRNVRPASQTGFVISTTIVKGDRYLCLQPYFKDFSALKIIIIFSSPIHLLPSLHFMPSLTRQECVFNEAVPCDFPSSQFILSLLKLCYHYTKIPCINRQWQKGNTFIY